MIPFMRQALKSVVGDKQDNRMSRMQRPSAAGRPVSPDDMKTKTRLACVQRAFFEMIQAEAFLHPAKKTILMFLGALLLFFVLASMDDFDNVSENIRESLSNDPMEGPPVDREFLIRFLTTHNENIGRLYLSLESFGLHALPMKMNLMSEYDRDFTFLKNRGRVMDVRIEEIELKAIRWTSPEDLEVVAEETAEVKYLDRIGGRTVEALPKSAYTMKYTLQRTERGWLVREVETMEVRELEPDP